LEAGIYVIHKFPFLLLFLYIDGWNAEL